MTVLFGELWCIDPMCFGINTGGMDGWDKKMMQRKSLAYDDVENFPNKFLADYLFILDEIKGDIPNVSEGILKSLESLDKKMGFLKRRD